jgi:methionyl-tRNA formyltransferase
MLPAVVWQMPKYGTFNLHASLLPQYRGAAPINFAIINGETETGLTTFFLNEEIDKGAVIMRKHIAIRPDETAGELHDELMALGNQVMIETIQKIEQGGVQALEQDKMEHCELKPAPKITKEFCKVDWKQSGHSIYNHVRGLSPYPAAHTQLCSQNGEVLDLKIFACTFSPDRNNDCIGSVSTDNKDYLKVVVNDGFIFLTEIQQAGKKRMSIADFLRGTQFGDTWNAIS